MNQWGALIAAVAIAVVSWLISGVVRKTIENNQAAPMALPLMEKGRND